jgi:hypothetical protein
MACNASGMAPVSSGNFTNGQPFYMCAGDALGEGYRGGFNLRPTWANTCSVGAGGREVATSSYSCLCVATGATKPLGPVQSGPQFSRPPAPPPVVIVQEPAQPQGGRRINIDEATFGLNRGLPRGNATAHVTRWCDRARDLCDYTVDPAAFGGAGDSASEFTVRYHCGDDGRPKVAQTNVRGVMGQLVLSCP